MTPDPEIRFEQVRCNLCGADDTRLLFEEEDRRYPDTPRFRFRLVECRRCGLRYLNPRPDSASLSVYYPEVYYVDRPLLPARGMAHVLRALYPNRKHRALREKVSRASRLVATNGRMLEVGPAAGEFLVAMRARGVSVAAVERSESMLRRLRDELKVDAYPPGELTAGMTEPFDLVAAWNTFEHLPDPAGFLDWAHSLLGPGGALLLSAPNAHALERRLFFGGDSCEDLPRHFYAFTPTTLRRMLESHGFRDACISQVTRVATSETQDRIESRFPRRGAVTQVAKGMYNVTLLPVLWLGDRVSAALGGGHTLVVSARKH